MIPACISHRHNERPKQAWCGRTTTLAEWAYTDIDHAAYAMLRGGDRMVPCPVCVAAVTAALTTPTPGSPDDPR